MQTERSWIGEMRQLEWDLARRLDYAAVSPDIEFVAFLRSLSRFGFFVFGPITIDVNIVEEILLRTHPRGEGGPDHPPVSELYVQLTAAVWTTVTNSGSRRTDELHMLLTFMRWGQGLPARVFGELGVSPEEVERHVAQMGQRAPGPLGPERLYSTDEAADYLGVHPQTVRGWIRAGRLPASRLAGQKSIRIRSSDLQAVLEPIEPTNFDQ
jgi:excisionase family DNA binding protein